VPAPDEHLTNLLADLPGRVRATFYAEPTRYVRGGWQREVIDFLGVDGTWRRLNMGDLHLPESDWPGFDNFGAGQLSPDGQWWAARSRGGAVVLDLETGEVLTSELPGRSGRRGAAAYWWNPDSNLAYVQGSNNVDPGYWISVPGMRVRRASFYGRPVWTGDHGEYLVSASNRGDSVPADVYSAANSVLRKFTISTDFNQPYTSVTDLGGESVVGMAAGDPNREHPAELLLVDATTWEVRYRLIVRGGDISSPYGIAFDENHWQLYSHDYTLVWLPEQHEVQRLLDLRSDDYPGTATAIGFARDLVFIGS